MEQGPLGLNPELRTPPLPATHVRAGTGHRVLARNYTTDKVGPPTCEFTRDVRPRVATFLCPSPCRPLRHLNGRRPNVLRQSRAAGRDAAGRVRGEPRVECYESVSYTHL